MEYTKFGSAQKRETLINNLSQIETQHYGRSLDVQHWRLVADSPLTEATGVDDRILNNRNEEAKQQLAGALYDIEKLELKAKVLRDELARLDSDPKGAGAKRADA